MRLLHGYRATQAAYVVAKLGVADRLAAGQATAAELAEAVGVDAGSLGRVLRLGAYVGLLDEVDGERFSLTGLGELLRTGVPGSLRALAVMLGQEHYRAWADLLSSVRTGEPAFPQVFGRPLFDYLAADAAAQADFDAAMADNAELHLRSLTTKFDFSGHRVVVDVGGGRGAVVASILTANPDVKAILFDQPQVLTAAESFLRGRGILDRCQLVPGNFFESIPSGGDVYVLSLILHDWDDQAALKILRNCRGAMQPSNTLLILESVVPPHGTPSPAALFDVNMLVMLGGKERTEAEFRALLEDGGFRLRRVIPLSERRSIVEAAAV